MTDTKFESEPMRGRRSTDRPYERVSDNGDERDRDDDHYRDDVRRTDVTSPEVKMVATRETRISLFTTEFWLTVFGAAGLVIAGYWDEAELSLDLAYALAAGIVAAYILSRGFAKAGSGEPVVKNLRQ